MQYMNIIFVCNDELKGGMQGYLGNQLKFQLQLFGCKRARAPIHVLTIVGTLVRFEVGPVI